jgi:hypothetical protein
VALVLGADYDGLRTAAPAVPAVPGSGPEPAPAAPGTTRPLPLPC